MENQRPPRLGVEVAPEPGELLEGGIVGELDRRRDRGLRGRRRWGWLRWRRVGSRGSSWRIDPLRSPPASFSRLRGYRCWRSRCLAVCLCCSDLLCHIVGWGRGVGGVWCISRCVGDGRGRRCRRLCGIALRWAASATRRSRSGTHNLWRPSRSEGIRQQHHNKVSPSS